MIVAGWPKPENASLVGTAPKTTLTIPSTLTSGTTYYLGVIIDYNGALTETNPAGSSRNVHN